MDRRERLLLLSFAHYAYAAYIVFSAILVALFFALMSAFQAFAQASAKDPFPELPMPIAPLMWLVLAFIAVLAGLYLWAGRSIARRRHWTFCLVLDCLALTSLPFGTLLGIFGLVLLLDAETRTEFEAAKSPGLTTPSGARWS